MNLIDHTPYLSASGEISFLNQIRASLKYGAAWLPEIQSQKIVIDTLNYSLVKGYTLMRNIILPGSEATIPLILVGPAGVSVIVVTNLKGTYQAKGDKWEIIEGGKSRSAKTNLMVLTSKMTRAVQLYLKRQGIEVAAVDGVLICSDPGMHVDSTRPIVRVILRDAIEHYVTTINHSSPILAGKMAQTIVNRLINPQESQTPAAEVAQVAQPMVGTPEVSALDDVFPWADHDNNGSLEFEFIDDGTQDLEKPFGNTPDTPVVPSPVQLAQQSVKNHFSFDKKQWTLLIAFGVVEITILVVFFWLITSNS